MATAVTNLNTTGHEGRAWLTSDELTVALSTTHDGLLSIDMTTPGAGQPFATPDNKHLAMVNAKASTTLLPYCIRTSGWGCSARSKQFPCGPVLRDAFERRRQLRYGGPDPTVNTGFSEFEPVLSQDGCDLYFASDRDADRHYHLFHARVTN